MLYALLDHPDSRTRDLSSLETVYYGASAINPVRLKEAIDRFPDKGDHESNAFPELASEGKLRAYRHEGLWLTVNTPKELRVAQEHVAAHPEWLA